jgi:hypothetical protein
MSPTTPSSASFIQTGIFTSSPDRLAWRHAHGAVDEWRLPAALGTVEHDWKQITLGTCRVHLSSASSDQQLSQFGHVQRCVYKGAPRTLLSSAMAFLVRKYLSGTPTCPHSRGRPTDGYRWPCLPAVNRWHPMDTAAPTPACSRHPCLASS